MTTEFPAGARVFRYKLDFYYQQALLYLVTLVLYAGVRGSFEFDRLPTLGSDPMMYIIILFVIISFAVLALNRARERKLVVARQADFFTNQDREILSDIDGHAAGSGVTTAGIPVIVS